MRVSIIEREEVGGIAALTKFFVEGKFDEVMAALQLFEDQALDREREQHFQNEIAPKIADVITEKLERDSAAELAEARDRVLKAATEHEQAQDYADNKAAEKIANIKEAAAFADKKGEALGGLRGHKHNCPDRGEPKLFDELQNFFEEVLFNPASGSMVRKIEAATMAKMFMAKWRRDADIPPLTGDAYYLASLGRRLANAEKIRDEAAGETVAEGIQRRAAKFKAEQQAAE